MTVRTPKGWPRSERPPRSALRADGACGTRCPIGHRLLGGVRGHAEDPIALLEEQNAERVPWLVPLRHGRMGVSPFTFYRGTARIMAADLATTPSSGLAVQLGGDAHLSNFGAYGSPERQLVFDANDFDETLPGPWEWDLKRLAASFTIGGQQLGFDEPARRRITARVVAATAPAMHRYARLGYLDIWYDHLTITDARATKKAGAAEMETRLVPLRAQGPLQDQPAGAREDGGRGERALPDPQRPAGAVPVPRPSGRIRRAGARV